MKGTDATHDPSLRSWVDSANDPATDFPIQNLPVGVFRRGSAAPTLGIAIGDAVLDLAAAARAGLLPGAAKLASVFSADSLNGLMGQGRNASRVLRTAASALLREGNPDAPKRRGEILVLQSDVELLLPVRVGDYTDFYASIHHATNVGGMFRPDSPLLPNYKYVPIGYHGRASSIVVSGTRITRPHGQTKDDQSTAPVYGPTRRLDYEMEIGAYVALPNNLGAPVPLSRAHEHLWGVCLLNDWSARDVQSWEYQPLGPFLAKNFATSVSPWVVTLDALEPFRVPAAARADGDPKPLPYLADADDAERGAIDLTVEVTLRTARMRDKKRDPFLVSRGRLRDMYWTFGQLLAHHTSNGCNLQPGDILGSGTVSGPTRESRGCLLERTWRGTEPLELPDNERRAFLEDGDEVTLRAYAQRDGFRRIGLGTCVGTIAAARAGQ